MLWADFCGGFYKTRAPIMGSDQAINLYTETREAKGSPKDVTMYGTPGLKLETTLATAQNRGWFTQDGQTWTIVGDTLYERTAAATYVSRGTVGNDGLLVSFASNGQGGSQLAIVSASNLYTLNLTTNALAVVTLPFSNPVMIVFQDGYGLINEANTPKVWFSALEDFSTWDALDFFARSFSSDNLVGIAVTRDRLWVLGSKTSTQYYDSGDADNPWQPYPGTTIQVGCVTPTSISVYNDTLRWLARSPRGEAKIVQAKADSSVQELSTPPIADVLQSCSTLDDAEAFTYAQNGHAFFVITLPSCPDAVKTYHFDILENEWGARAGWDTTTAVYTRWRGRGQTAAGQDILVGDYLTGDVYTLDMTTYADNGVPLIAERTAPYASAENQWIFLRQIELGMQSGVGLAGTAQGSDPAVELLISRDGAQTFVSAGLASLGKLGVYAARAIWRNLGRVRADRMVIRVRQSDPVARVWGPGLWVTIEKGTGQL